MKGFFICIAHGVKGHYYNLLLCFPRLTKLTEVLEVEFSGVETHLFVAFYADCFDHLFTNDSVAIDSQMNARIKWYSMHIFHWILFSYF